MGDKIVGKVICEEEKTKIPHKEPRTYPCKPGRKYPAFDPPTPWPEPHKPSPDETQEDKQ